MPKAFLFYRGLCGYNHIFAQYLRRRRYERLTYLRKGYHNILIKDLFLLDPEFVFLNHGSFGATPRPVFQAYQAWQAELEAGRLNSWAAASLT